MFAKGWHTTLDDLDSFLWRHKIPPHEWAEFLYERYKGLLFVKRISLRPSMIYGPRVVSAYNDWLVKSTEAGYRATSKRSPSVEAAAKSLSIVAMTPRRKRRDVRVVYDRSSMLIALCEFAHRLDSRAPDHILLDAEHWDVVTVVSVLEDVL